MKEDEAPYRKRLAGRPSGSKDKRRQSQESVKKKAQTSIKQSLCALPQKVQQKEPAQKHLGGLFATVNMKKGQNEIVHLGEMLNSECTDYKEKALDEVREHCQVGLYCHDCSCVVERKFKGKVGRCLLDGWHAKKHKCSKVKFDPKHPKNIKMTKGMNTSAAEQLWSRMNKLHFATHMGRANYRAFLRHYCIWRNNYIRAQMKGKFRIAHEPSEDNDNP